MKRILVTGCGGAAAINFTRSLRDADKNGNAFYLVGVDCDPYTIHRNECDTWYLCPKAEDGKYIPYLLEIMKRENIEFVHAQPDVEVYTIGKHRKELLDKGCRVFLPRQETIEILQDKEKSYRVWKEAGIQVPETILINNEEDLQRAFSQFGSEIWTRDTSGAGGKGSLSRPSYDLARAWIEHRKTWGKTIASQHLTSRTVTWQSMWNNGDLVIGQGRTRAYWELSDRTQSGVTGATGMGVIFNDRALGELAVKCITAVDQKPHGIFSVDFTYDKKGVPNPTEINIGRFFTTHHFLSRAGCNMPDILVQLAFFEYRGEYNIINPCTQGACWIRGIDKEPVMLKERDIEVLRESYLEILSKL